MFSSIIVVKSLSLLKVNCSPYLFLLLEKLRTLYSSEQCERIDYVLVFKPDKKGDDNKEVRLQ